MPDFFVVEDTKLNHSKTQHEDDEETYRDNKKENNGNAANMAGAAEPRSSVVGEKIEKKRIVKKAVVKKVRGGEDIDDYINENIIKVNKTMSKTDQDLIMNSLRNHYVFYALTDEELEFIIQKMFYCENTDEYVFKQEDKASSYFIIDKGSVEIIINEEVISLFQRPPISPTTSIPVARTFHFP